MQADTTSTSIISQSQTTTSIDSTDKSGSSKSMVESIDKADEDLTKDNVASPIDLECHIQAERITKILDEALYKTKVAIAVNNLVYDYYHPMKRMLSEQYLDELMFVFEQYENSLYSQSLVNIGALEDLREGNISLKNRLNPELGHIIYILTSCKKLKPIIDKIVEKLKIDYENQTPEPNKFKTCFEYLMTLKKFKEIMVKRMETSAAEILSEKITTRKLEEKNKEHIEHIEVLTETMKQEEENFQKTIADRTQNIFDLRQELGFLDNLAKARFSKQVVDSDREMVMAFRAHQAKNEMLKEEEVDTREHYHEFLNRCLVDEKNQRARRLKVETQLLSWIQKYDNEMTDKQKELDDFIEKYKVECEKVEKLEKDLEEQDKEYIPLMAERDEEYNQEMTEKMNAFLVEHAARVIQTAWKQVQINRAEKKKLKKAVQKMKEAAEKAALKAEAQAKKEELAAKKAAKLAAKEAKAEKLRQQKEAVAAKLAETEAAEKEKREKQQN